MQSFFPRLVVAGTHSGVGKTTVALALLAAFASRGKTMQAFKVGPDFIDPGHHRAVTGRDSYNLDGWMLGMERNRHTFLQAAAEADLSIIEGMMGLFDGSSPVEERGSTAEMAKVLQAPVLLVIDGSAMARSVAAMAKGFQQFDPELQVIGVLFNRLSGDGHYQLLREALEQQTNLKAVGYLQKDAEIVVEDRHLGLRMALEQESPLLYQKLGRAAALTIDLDMVEKLASTAPPVQQIRKEKQVSGGISCRSKVRIGIAYDPAFCFYYPANLTMLESAGAELIRFSPLDDYALPDCHGLYFGGGYPELYARRLHQNGSMRTQIRQFAERGGLIYAECGGLMYLSRSIRDFEDQVYEMVEVVPADIIMDRAHLTLGYRTVTLNQSSWLGPTGLKVRGHEFHYSSFGEREALSRPCHLQDSRGMDKGADGFLIGNCLALYTHLHFSSQPSIAQMMVDTAQHHSSSQKHRPMNVGNAT